MLKLKEYPFKKQHVVQVYFSKVEIKDSIKILAQKETKRKKKKKPKPTNFGKSSLKFTTWWLHKLKG